MAFLLVKHLFSFFGTPLIYVIVVFASRALCRAEEVALKIGAPPSPDRLPQPEQPGVQSPTAHPGGLKSALKLNNPIDKDARVPTVYNPGLGTVAVPSDYPLPGRSSWAGLNERV